MPGKQPSAAYGKEPATNRSTSGSTWPAGKPITSTAAPANGWPGQASIEAVCPDCGGSGVYRQDVPVGHPAFGKVVLCQNPVHGLARLQRFAHLSEMTGREQALTLDDILPLAGNEQMLAAARQMVATPRGWLYIWGGPGNAKSDVLCAIVNELNRSGHGPALYIKWTRLANLMSESFAERRYRGAMLSSGVAPGSSAFANLGYLDRFERLVRLPVLAIDEADKARLTEFREEFRFDFFDERWRQAVVGQSVTIFAGQTNPTKGSESAPLASRFSDGRFQVIENTAGDARPDARW